MFEIFDRIRAKIKELLYRIPDPLRLLFGKREAPEPVDDGWPLCELCHPNQDPNENELPDDFRDIKLDKDIYLYDVKLTKLKPEQWKLAGRNVLNQVYEDPIYGYSTEDSDIEERDPLPPPPHPSEKVKATQYPLLSVNLKGLRYTELEELGEVLYKGADYFDMDTDELATDDEGGDVNSFYDIPGMQERLDDATFDPEEKIAEELTVQKRITTSDVVPGVPLEPWQDNVQDWVNCRVFNHKPPEEAHPSPSEHPAPPLAQSSSPSLGTTRP